MFCFCQESKAIFTVQLETGNNGGLLKKKCIELYSSECSLSSNGDAANSVSGNKDNKADVKIENPEGK